VSNEPVPRDRTADLLLLGLAVSFGALEMLTFVLHDNEGFYL
jgi:hypothetical protein